MNTKRFMDIEEYLHTYFGEKSRPSKRIIMGLIKEGQIPGRKLGRHYYVDTEADARSTGNRLVDAVLGSVAN